MDTSSGNNRHTIDNPESIQTLDFKSDNNQQDVLDVSQLLPDSGVNASNLKQFVKITGSGVFVDSSGSGQFSVDSQVARFASGGPALNAMVAVQVADTSIIHFDHTVNADDPLSDSPAIDSFDQGDSNEIRGTHQSDMLTGSSSADVMHGSWGDDVLEGGAGNDVYIGGAGSDRYVLTDTGSVETLDFKSTRFEKDVLDVSQLLPEGADANNLLSYLSITEEGVFLDTAGNGDFSEENQVARFTEDSVFSRNEILIDIGDNVRVVFNIFAQAGVQLQDGDAFQASDVLASRTQKYNPRGQDYESDSGPGADASTAFIRSKAGELFNFRLDQHQVEEAHGSDGGEILDAAQVVLSSDEKDDNVADHKLWMYGRDGGDTLQGNADGVMLDGGRGNDRIVAGGGRNMLIGGEGRDEFVLNLETTTGDDLRSDLLYDFTSLEGHRDLIDLQTVLPENVVAENIHAFVKVTDAGVFVDVNGGGQFDASNQLARFGERSDIDNLVRFRLPDGQEIEFNREDALSEQVGTRSGEQLRGGEGGDVLIGLAGDDVLDGDALTNDESADHLYGGRGNDTLIVDGLDLAQGTVEGGDGFDTAKIQGDTGESLSLNLQAAGIERAFGGFSDDVLDGSSYTGPDGFNKNSGAYEENNAQRIELFGKYGNDTLKGGIANDYLDGGYDDDVIAGGAGRDFMVGGSGNDTFVLSDDGEIDTIWDFKSTADQHDVLDLSAFLPSSTSLDDLSSHVHIDNKFVYFDPEGNSQFNYSNAVAKFGGASVVDEPVKISLGDGRVFSKEAGWSSDVVSTQNDGAFIITSELLIANSSLSSASNVSVTNLSSDSGQLTDNGDGTWTLMPNADFNGQLSLDYQVIETTMEADQLLFSTDFANFSSATAGASVLEANTGWQTSNPSGNVELHYETVYGGSDGSNRVIEVEAAVGDNNLYRNISTEAGRSYELNFDFSARQGVVSSGIDVYWGGEKISGLDGSSGQFNWQNQTLTLTGDGSEKRLEFRATSNEGAGGLLDNIQLTQVGIEVESDPVETSVMVSANTQWSVDGAHIIADGSEDQVLRFTESDLLSSSGESNGQSEVSNVRYEGSDGSLLEVAHIEFGSGTDGRIELDQRLSEYDAFSIEFEYTSTGAHSGGIDNVVSAQVPSSDNMLNIYIQNHDGSLHLDLGGTGIDFDGLNIQDGGMHTITMTWDSQNGAINVFDNGILIESNTFKQGLTVPSGGWVMVGQEQDSYGGSLDSTQSVTNTRIGYVAMSYDAVSQGLVESGISIVDGSSELAFDLRARNGEVVDTTNNFSVSTTGDVDAVHEYFEFTPVDDFAGNVSLSYDVSDGGSTVSSNGILSFAPENDGPELQVHSLSNHIYAAYSFTDLSDISGNGHGLAYSGSASVGTGRNGDSSAFEMNGTSGAAEISDLTTGGAMTVTAWAKFDSFDQSWSRVFDFGDGAANNNILVGHVGQTNALGFHLHDGQGGAPELNVENFFEAGQWVHVAVSIDSEGVMRAYKNGVLAGEAQGYVPTEEVRSGNYIGKSHWDVDGHLDGSIDDFVIFDGALTSEQILQIYEAGSVDNVVDSVFSVPEGSSNGTAVGQATASDIDDADSLTFSLSDDAGGRFTIDPSTGEITVANGALLDFETSGSHDLTIQVSDGSLTSSQQITVHVSDANEAPVVNAPIDLGVMTSVDNMIITKAMLLANVSDENGDDLSILNLSSSNGSIADNGNDSWTFTPGGDFTGAASLDFDVSDGQAVSASQATLNVNQVISEDNFNTGSDGWNQSTSTSGNFNTGNMLGRFGGTEGNEAVYKTFAVPEGASEVTLKFTLYEIDSWDGEQFQMFVDGQQYHARSYSHGSNAPGVEVIADDQGNTIGQIEHGQGGHVGFYGWVDQAHTYSMTIPVSSDQSSLKIGFGSTLNQALNDESWGIDNLVLSISQYAPESSDNSLIIQGGSIYHFSVADFEFSDSDAGDALQSIIITSLPQNGSLMLNGTAVTANQGIAVTDIGNLTFEYGDDSVSPTGFGFTVSDGQHVSNEHQFSISQGTQVQSEDLNSYSAGDVDGQNGWSVQKFNTSSSITVNDTAGHDGGKAMVFNSSGPGVGASATLPDSDVGILPDFNVTSSFALEVDIKKNYWGSVFGVGADGNNDGQITAKGSNSEQGLKFSFGSYNNSAMYITLADGTTVTTSAGNGSGWLRFRWEVDIAANDGQGQGSLMFKSLTDGAAEWTALPELTGLNLGLDPESSDASNPANWDGFFLHFEGAGSGLDGLRVETTSLSGTVDSDIVQGTSEADQLMGSLGDDTLLGDGGGDIIFGGAGDDVMTGGDGSDTFSWQLSDVGSAQNPAEDMIADFHAGQGGDVLDISDLITEEESAVEDLLALNFEDGSTIIGIKSSETGDVTQKIKLDGVDLSNYGGGSTDIEIINNLIDDGNLQV